MNNDLNDRFEKVQNSIKMSFYSTKKQYDQSSVGKLHKDINLWLKFWESFSAALQWLYKTFLWPITWRLWRVIRWLARQYRNLWLYITYKKDLYGTLQFSKTRGGLTILMSILMFYLLYGTVTVLITLPWYFLTVRHNEVLYLSNHSAVEGHTTSRLKINDVYEITGCEAIDCSDQDTVSFRVEATWFNEAWSVVHNLSLYYPDYVAAAVSPVVNRCTITSYGVRKKFLVRQWELHPEILQVRCVPVGLENQQGVHNRDYR